MATSICTHPDGAVTTEGIRQAMLTFQTATAQLGCLLDDTSGMDNREIGRFLDTTTSTLARMTEILCRISYRPADECVESNLAHVVGRLGEVEEALRGVHSHISQESS